MAQRKIFVSKAGIELAAMVTNDNEFELLLEINDKNAPVSTIVLDADDTADLIRELQKIKKIIAK